MMHLGLHLQVDMPSSIYRAQNGARSLDPGAKKEQTMYLGHNQVCTNSLHPRLGNMLKCSFGILVTIVSSAEKSDERAAIDEYVVGQICHV